MKAAPFELLRPTDLGNALALLAEDPDESKILAGGQSLIPMMNFRLARPARLIDINRVRGVAGIELDHTAVTIKSCTRHAALQQTDVPGPLGQLLRQSAAKIGHQPIRIRGTFGGSLAHCDAASEWCVVATLLDAQMTARSHARGTRTIQASEYFQSTFVTALAADEILTDTRLTLLDDSYVAGIAEYARRAGDFGIVLVAVAISILDGIVADAKICIGGVAPTPVRSTAAERECLGSSWSSGVLERAAEAAACEVNPPDDIHADAEYRRTLVRALLPRALASTQYEVTS